VSTNALARLAEIRRAAPDADVVVLSSSPGAGWLADALRAEASAVLPGNLEPHTLGVVLREVLAARSVHRLRPDHSEGDPAAVAAA
jgi:DNA-binding NarL/FixJ family response regulator